MTPTADKLAQVADPIMDRHFGIDPEATGAISVPILTEEQTDALVADLTEAFKGFDGPINVEDVEALVDINYHEAAQAAWNVAQKLERS